MGGDTFVVWRLDRLGRSLKHLIETVTALQQQHIAFKSITENIDTSTATGQLVFHIFGALAEFERNLITERTMAGLEAARARGRKGGRRASNLPHSRLPWRKSSMRIVPTRLRISATPSASHGQRCTATSKPDSYSTEPCPRNAPPLCLRRPLPGVYPWSRSADLPVRAGAGASRQSSRRGSRHGRPSAGY